MTETNDFKIYVIFSDTFSGHSELKYAASLSARLNSPLAVLIPNSLETANLLAKNSKQSAKEIQEIAKERIYEKAYSLINNYPSVSFEAMPDNLNSLNSDKTIFISNSVIFEQKSFSVVAPFDEIGVLERGPGEIMIPFGNGESGIFATTETLPLIKQLELNIIFWHTTWKNPALGAATAEMHMVPEAKSVLASIQAAADTLGVSHRYVVETADDVVEGITRFALKEHCVMIVMARGRKTGAGRYGERLIKRSSPIPVLMAGRGV